MNSPGYLKQKKKKKNEERQEGGREGGRDAEGWTKGGTMWEGGRDCEGREAGGRGRGGWGGLRAGEENHPSRNTHYTQPPKIKLDHWKIKFKNWCGQITNTIRQENKN